MIRLLIVAFLLVLPLSAQTAAVRGACEQGANTVSTSGMTSSTTVQKSFPRCTVNVYLTGTTTHATIYDTATSHVLANPFTAAADGSWIFWASTSGIYDVVMSGGTSPNVFPAPVTLSAISLAAGSGASTIVQVNGSPINPASPANFEDSATVTWDFTGGALHATALGGGTGCTLPVGSTNLFVYRLSSGQCGVTGITTDTTGNDFSLFSATNPTVQHGGQGYIGQIFLNPVYMGQTRLTTPQQNVNAPEADTRVYETVDGQYRGWNLGNAGGWTVKKSERVNHLSYVRGISQMRQTENWCFGAGDCANQYNYLHFNPGNFDASGEGVTGNTTNVNETPGVAFGHIVATVTTGSTTLPTDISPTSFITDGGAIIDTSKGTVSGILAGSGTVLGSTSVGILPVSGVSLPVTGVVGGSGYCMTTGDMPVPANPAVGASDVVGCTLQAGSFPANGTVVCIAGSSNWEQAVMSSISGSNMTIYHYKNHAMNFAGKLTSIWWGGLCGQRYSDDITVSQFTGFPQRNSYEVVGATDATHLAYTAYVQGSSPYIAPFDYNIYTLTGTTMTRTSNVVTFNLGQQNTLFNKQPTVTISNCGDSSFNGTVSLPLAQPANFSYVYSQTASDGSTTGCKMSFPVAQFNGFHLYPGAEAIRPLDHDNANIYVSPNTVPWTAGDNFEALHGYAARLTGTTITSLMDTAANATLSGGLFVNIGGRGANQTFYGINIRNNNQCSLYIGCGGNLTVPPAIHTEQANAGLVWNQAPVPGNPWAYIGDFGDGQNHTLRLIATNHSYIDVNYATNIMDISATTMNGKSICLADGTNCQVPPSTWTIKFQARDFNYPLNTPYYIGETGYVGTNSNVSYRVPAACALTAITASAMIADGGTVPSSEVPQFELFNVTTSTAIWTASFGPWSANQTTITNTNPAASVAAGNLLRVRIFAPSWGTPPGNTAISATVYCK